LTLKISNSTGEKRSLISALLICTPLTKSLSSGIMNFYAIERERENQNE